MEGMPAGGTGLPIVGTEIAGKYRIESVLGQGGMGTVYAARNALTGKRVAIKWLLPEHAGSSTRDRLLREAQIASSIDHPNVVDIYDVGEHQGGLFLVMEYLRGKPLSEVLAERGRLEPGELIAMLMPAMRGVHAAHQAGVIHRDLKPENIILSESDGQIVPKVLDFGVSKTIGASAVPNSSLTRTGALVGTPHYMALEQVDGSNAVDARTDVYAFGVLLYRALTGHYPFDGSSLGEVILKIGTKEAPPMRMLRPELPPALDAIVLRSLSRQRDKRFLDLEQMTRALSPFAAARRSSDSIDTITVPGAVAVDIRPLLGEAAAASAHGSAHGGPRSSSGAVSGLDAQRGRRRAIAVGAAVAVVLTIAGVLTYRGARPTVDAEASTAAVPQASAGTTAPAPTGGTNGLDEPTPALAAPLAEEPGAAGGSAGTQDPAGRSNAAGELAPGGVPAAGEGSAQAGTRALATVAVDARASGDGPGARAVQPGTPAAGSTRLERRAAQERQKPPRAAPAVHKSNVPAVIRGERTNGFSPDEF